MGPTPALVTPEAPSLPEPAKQERTAPSPQQPQSSFEDLFVAEAEAEPQEELIADHRGLQIIGRIAAVALALLAAAVVVVILWPGVTPSKPATPRIVESFPAPSPTATPGELAAALRVPPQPTAAAVLAAPAPSAAPRPTEPLVSAAPPHPRRPAPVEVEAGVETMRSSDWAGRQAVFVVHFSSYRSRENANADAARLGAEFGHPAHALVVDLGEKGTWYRVVVGDFATADDARAFRAEIAARKTHETGGVYRLSAP